MIRKLAVFGCSYSDYLPLNHTVYGLELSALLNSQYLHEGAGSGSNWRIWRRLGTMAVNGELTAEDAVIIQYTSVERREFWSRRRGRVETRLSYVSRDPGPESGELLRYKAMSWQWHDHRAECNFLKDYEQNFLSTQHETQLFELQHLQFQLMLNYFKLRVIFLDCRHTPLRPLQLLAPFAAWAWTEPQSLQDEVCYNYAQDDNSHLSDQGHQQLADLLYQHTAKLDW